MKGNFLPSLRMLLEHEGGFVNHLRDPGGMTNLGVTKRTWEDFVGRQVDEAEMRALKPEDVAPLYKARYWDAIRGDDLPAGVDHAVFDFAVNSGVVRAARFLQRAAGVETDGVIGPKTIEAARRADADELVRKICEARLAFLENLPTFDIFGRGWSRRVAKVRTQSEGMA